MPRTVMELLRQFDSRVYGKHNLQHFLICQVRVRIIEGRQLAGANISPVVRVTIDNQTRQTKVIKSTNKPFYDEVCGTEIFTSCTCFLLGVS